MTTLPDLLDPPFRTTFFIPGAAMLLEYAAFVALAAKCAPGVAPEDLASHGTVESGYETLAVHDNGILINGRLVPGKPIPTPADANSAIAITNELLGAGHSVDVGLMQINAKNFDWLGLTLEKSFDACESLRAAADHLRAISRYNSGKDDRGLHNGYDAKIMKARYGSDHQSVAPLPAKVAEAPPEKRSIRVFPSPEEDPRK